MPTNDGWEDISQDDGWEDVSPDQFPDMPSPSMRNQAQPWQMPQVGNVDQLAQFQKEQEPPAPPPLLARQPGQRDPVDIERVLRENMAQAGSFGTTPQPEDMPEGADAKIGMAATIASLPFMAGGASALGGGVAGLRGLSTANKARQIAGATGTVAKTGAVFYAAEKALETAGVPPGARAAILGAMGVTRPGEAARKAIKGVFGSAEGAAVGASERYAAKITAAKAEEAARKAGLEALGASKAAPKMLSEAEKAAAAVRPWETPLPAGQRAMATNLGGSAGSGPAPTKDLAGDLKATLEYVRINKALPKGGAVPTNYESTVGRTSRVADIRKDIGAEKAARQLGGTKEQVRLDADTVLGEALGEASDVMPKKALETITAKMRSLPMAEREAYIARSTSPKNKAQMELIRRTLEHLGLLLPVGVATGVMGSE